MAEIEQIINNFPLSQTVRQNAIDVYKLIAEAESHVHGVPVPAPATAYILKNIPIYGGSVNSELCTPAGALEVYTVDVGMKKSGPGVMICVMCKEQVRDEMLHLIFKHTSTLEIRENVSRRYTLRRKVDEVETEFGNIRIKYSDGYGVVKEKYEYDDIAAIAAEKGLSIDEVIRIVENGRK